MTRTQFAILIAVIVSATVTILLVCSNRAAVKPVAPSPAAVTAQIARLQNHGGDGR